MEKLKRKMMLNELDTPHQYECAPPSPCMPMEARDDGDHPWWICAFTGCTNRWSDSSCKEGDCEGKHNAYCDKHPHNVHSNVTMMESTTTNANVPKFKLGDIVIALFSGMSPFLVFLPV